MPSVPFNEPIEDQMSLPHNSPILTTLDGRAAGGYIDISQVKSAVAVHLFLQNVTTWRNRPRLTSKACRLTREVPSRGQSSQCCGPSHLCPACHGYPASTSSQGTKMHEGSTNLRLMQELRSATDLALRVTKVTARSLGKAMSTLVA